VSLEREEEIGNVLTALGDAGLPVSGYGRIVPSLEDVFIRLIDTNGEARE
jgi:hypothetical protein